MNRLAAVRAGALAIALTSVAAGCDREGGEARAPGQQGMDVSGALTGTPTAAQGSELYAVCSPCHGPQGEGTQLAPPLLGPEWIHIDGSRNEIQRIIRDGVAAPRDYPIPMPPMGGGDFAEAELDLLAAYVLSLRSG